MKVRSLLGLFNHSAFHWWSAQCAPRMLLLSDELMSCCAAGANGCLDLRRRAFPLDGQVSAKWGWCPGSMARRARESVQGCQMLDRKYGKCLSNLWQMFGKQLSTTAIFLALLIFHYKTAIFLAILISYLFAIDIFSMLSNVLSLTIKNGLLYVNQNVCSVDEIYVKENSCFVRT